MKILIATPVYGEPVADFTRSVMGAITLLNNKGIRAEWADCRGCCYVHKARNRLTEAFRTQTDFTDILWWDSDIGTEPEDVLRLVSHEMPIVGGAAPYRFGGVSGFPAELKRDKEGHPLGFNGLVAAVQIPTAMLKVNRMVFDKLEQLGMAPLRIEFNQDGKEVHRYRSFFDFEVDPLRYIEYGEDVTFCRKAVRAGYQLWIEPNMTIRHHGLSFNTGNLLRHYTTNGAKP